MNISTKTVSAALAVGLAASLMGCSGTPLLADWGGPRRAPPGAVVLVPGEKVTLDLAAANRTEHFCANGAALHCERMSLKLYCTCPGIRP